MVTRTKGSVRAPRGLETVIAEHPDDLLEAVAPGGQNRGDGLKHPGHHLGLYPQEDVIGLGHNGGAVSGGAAQLGGQSLRLGGGAVAENDLVRRDMLHSGLRQSGAHVAGADKAKGVVGHT